MYFFSTYFGYGDIAGVNLASMTNPRNQSEMIVVYECYRRRVLEKEEIWLDSPIAMQAMLERSDVSACIVVNASE
jgi:hypothetical protein